MVTGRIHREESAAGVTVTWLTAVLLAVLVFGAASARAEVVPEDVTAALAAATATPVAATATPVPQAIPTPNRQVQVEPDEGVAAAGRTTAKAVRSSGGPALDAVNDQVDRSAAAVDEVVADGSATAQKLVDGASSAATTHAKLQDHPAGSGQVPARATPPVRAHPPGSASAPSTQAEPVGPAGLDALLMAPAERPVASLATVLLAAPQRGGLPRANESDTPASAAPSPDPAAPLPLPAPLSGSASPGGGFTSFILIAALMALLAIAAPALLRRFIDTGGIGPPVAFVCALERPG